MAEKQTHKAAVTLSKPASPLPKIPRNRNPEQGAIARECGGIKRLFGYCYETCAISNNDVLPVGNGLFSEEKKKCLRCDFSKIGGLFEKMEEEAGAFEKESGKISKWLKMNGIEIDLELFSVLCAFSRAFQRGFKPNSSISETRDNAYEMGEVKLSDSFKEGFAECAEIAAISQHFLQRRGVNSKYFSGAVLWSREDEFAEPHSFIFIRWRGKEYVFDPANPMQGADGSIYPRILSAPSTFEAEIGKNAKVFVTCTNILSGGATFYGVDNHMNVIPEKHIV
jgi:hypothetical protein